MNKPIGQDQKQNRDLFEDFEVLADQVKNEFLDKNQQPRGPKKVTLKRDIDALRDKLGRATPGERSDFLRRVVSYVVEAWQNDAWRKDKNAFPVKLHTNTEYENRLSVVRIILRSWDAMVLASDLAVGQVWAQLRSNKLVRELRSQPQGGEQDELPDDHRHPSRTELDLQQNWRMQALAREPFMFDPHVRLVELTLFRRDDDSNVDRSDLVDTPQASDQARPPGRRRGKKLANANKEKIKVWHCVAVDPQRSQATEQRTGQKPAKSSRKGSSSRKDADELSDSMSLDFRASTAAYVEALEGYVKKFGTTIALDGHIDRDPRYPKYVVPGNPRPSDFVWGSQVDSSDPSEIEFEYDIRTAAEEAKKVDESDNNSLDAEYVETVVNAFASELSSGAALVHLMEGIDERFLEQRIDIDDDRTSLERRVGTTAHMFIVFDNIDSIQPASAELIANMRQLLLRFCAHYGAIESRRLSRRLHEQSNRERRRAEEIADDRDTLRRRAMNVQAKIKLLQDAADELNKMIDENLRVGAYLRWLRVIDQLFKSENQSFELRGTSLKVSGNHNQWSRDQLAAALWNFAVPKPQLDNAPSPTTLWDTLFVMMPEEEILKNAQLHLIYRLRSYDRIRTGLPDSELEQTFNAFKNFTRINRESEQISGRLGDQTPGSGAEPLDTRETDISQVDTFTIKEILFLMGRASFNDTWTNEAPQADDADPTRQATGKAAADSKQLEDPTNRTFTFTSQKVFEALLAFANAIDKGLSDQDIRQGLRDRQDESKSRIRGGIVEDDPTRGFYGRAVRVLRSRHFKDESGNMHPLCLHWRGGEDPDPDALERGSILEVVIKQDEMLSLRTAHLAEGQRANKKKDNFIKLFDKVMEASGAAKQSRGRQDVSRNETSNAIAKILGLDNSYQIQGSTSKDSIDRELLSGIMDGHADLKSAANLDIKYLGGSEIKLTLGFSLCLSGEERDSNEWYGLDSVIDVNDKGLISKPRNVEQISIARILVNYERSIFLIMLRSKSLMYGIEQKP